MDYGWVFFIFIIVSGSIVGATALSKNNWVSFEPILSEQDSSILKMLYSETPKSTEFFGVMDSSNKTVSNFQLIGYKNLETGKIELTTDFKLSETKISIHSHPDRVCLASENDFISAEILNEKLFCVYCGKIVCYGDSN